MRVVREAVQHNGWEEERERESGVVMHAETGLGAARESLGHRVQ